MSLLRIRIQAPDRATARTARVASESGDSYVERLLKLIPAEAIGIYLVGLQVVGGDQATQAEVARWTLATFIFVLVFRAVVSTESPNFGLAAGKGLAAWWRGFRADVQWPAVFIAAVSFLVWASALGYPIAPFWSDGLNGCPSGSSAASVVCPGQKAGTLVLLLWTPLAAFLYSGQRIGNLAPVTNKGGDPGSAGDATPSPRDTAPARSPGRSVLDPDSRQRPDHADRSPYTSIALLHAFASGQNQARQIGTGWLVGPQHVVTAAHVVKGASRIRGWFGYDDATGQSAAYFESREFAAHPEYVDYGSSAHDIAVITLHEAIGNLAPLPTKSPSASAPEHVFSAGYPEDHGGLTMLTARGVTHRVDGNRFFHTIDTDEGQSGSPIWHGMQSTVTAVHVGGESDDNPGLNRGVYLSAAIADWIRQTTT